MSHDAHLPGYTIRRPLDTRSLLPAVGVGLAVGLAAFYVARVLLERQPVLSDGEREQRARAIERRTGRRVTTLGGEMVGSLDDLDEDVFLAPEDGPEGALEDEVEDELEGDRGIGRRARNRTRG